MRKGQFEALMFDKFLIEFLVEKFMNEFDWLIGTSNKESQIIMRPWNKIWSHFIIDALSLYFKSTRGKKIPSSIKSPDFVGSAVKVKVLALCNCIILL